jgi:branched-chain amino acid transport system substrate-binding protein
MVMARIAIGMVLTVLAAGTAHAQISGNVVKIGVINDQSSLYADITGQGSVLAARMAVEDAKLQGLTVEVVFADHQNKPDVGTSLVRQWFDRDGVDAVADVPTSSVALAVN